MRVIKKIFATTAAAMITLTSSALAAQAKDSNYIFGTFFTSDKDTRVQCYTSEDGIHMNHLTAIKYLQGEEKLDFKGRDPSCQYYKGAFYICLVDNTGDNTFKIYSSTDLKNWKEKSFSVTVRNEKYNNIWAPDLFIDNNGAAYVYFSKQKGYISKKDERTFDIYVSKIDNIEKFTEMEFQPAEIIKWPKISNGNYIDAQVRKINNAYYMILKNESIKTNNDNKSPVLLKSNRPDGEFTEVESWPLKNIRGYEGFSILTKNDKVYIYGDNYSHKYDRHKTANHTVWIANKNNIANGPYEAHYVEAPNPLRHGSLILIDSNLKRKLEANRIPFEPLNNEANDTNNNQAEANEKFGVKFDKELFGNSESKGNTIIIDEFAPALDVDYYSVPNKKNVIINHVSNPYGVKKFTIALTDGASLTMNCLKNLDQNSIKKEEGGADILVTFSIDGNGEIKLNEVKTEQ